MQSDSTVGYYAVIDQIKSKGVTKKITDTVTACNNLFSDAKAELFDESISGVLGFFNALLKTQHQIIFIRYTTMLTPFIFLASILLRIKGKKIIIDVPTPRCIVWKEMIDSHNNIFYKLINLSVMALSVSWIFLPANLIIQYAEESRYFNLGMTNKTLKIGNGIVIHEEIPLQSAVWPNKELVLIGAARLAYWHGFDRVMRAMYELKQENLGYDIRFKVVGDGSELAILKQMVAELELQEQVEFTGIKEGTELDKVFENAHVGISSLGLYRKNLTEASDLKTREYLSRGFMVIAAGNDIDFPSENPFRVEIPNDNSIAELKNILRSFGNKKLPNSNLARQYALNHLSFDAKLSKIFDLI